MGEIEYYARKELQRKVTPKKGGLGGGGGGGNQNCYLEQFLELPSRLKVML